MKKALIVVTSIAKYDELSRPTGLWFGEVVHFANVLLKNGYEIDYVSPQGGYTPIDPESLKKDVMTQLDWEYYQDKSFMNQLGKTLTPAEINSENYQVIYYAGGHGVIWDFKENDSLQKITEDIYSKNGVVSSVCHGVIGLLNIKDNNNQFLIKDKNITGFSNSEEIEAGLDTHVPYLPEDEIKKRGANYIQEKNWTSFAVSDGKIVTGQNPQSGKAVAEEVLKVIKN